MTQLMIQTNRSNQYFAAIKEGIVLSGIDVNFLLVGLNEIYSDVPLKNAKHDNGVYSCSRPHEIELDIKTETPEHYQKALGIECNPIRLLTKDATKRHFHEMQESYNIFTPGFANYIENISDEDFRKMLIVFSFHEASHRKYEGNSEAFVIRDELLLAERRPDLKPFICAHLEGNQYQYYIESFEQAKRMIKSSY